LLWPHAARYSWCRSIVGCERRSAWRMNWMKKKKAALNHVMSEWTIPSMWKTHSRLNSTKFIFI
jgi:hypothetical protein